jgi:hypothetical protein
MLGEHKDFGGIMIQRYRFETSEEWTGKVVEDDNGEWVKWEDIKHLIPKDDTDFIQKCIDQDKPVPPGIWYCDWNKINIGKGIKMDGCSEIRPMFK